jgi:predicted amidohydrolase
MNEKLKIAVIQTDLVWENAFENRLQLSNKIRAITETVDVIILPEMFTTGFSMQPENLAETMQGETVLWMQKIASEKNAALCGSVIISEENKYYNRFLFVYPSGKVEYYNKRHLFTLAGEEKVYSAGSKKLIIDFKGWKICPLVCYDLRFPVWSRNTNDYDLLIYVANWPKPRVNAWDALLKARSIENMSYVVGVNRVGFDANNFEYLGHSAVYDCLGEPLVSPINNEQEIVVELNKEHLVKTRQRFNFLNDQDSFEIK